MTDDDWMLGQGTVEFRQTERDHANGRGMTTGPSARVVTLRGARRAWFMEPLSDRRHEYRQNPDDPSSWRHVTEEGKG